MKAEEVLLSELIDTISDTKKVEKSKAVLINTSDVLNGFVCNHNYVDNFNLKGQFKKRFKKGDILYSEIRPNNRRFAYIDFNPDDYIASTKLMVLRKKSNKITNRYLYYSITNDTFIEKMQYLAESRSGTFPQITFDVLKKEKVLLPSIEIQNKIVKILDSINNKIKLNNEINDNLYDILLNYYKSVVVNDDVNEEKHLEEFCNIFTGRKNANEFDENGEYKFFTCGDKPLRINTYIYDGPAIIISGNGSYTGRTNFYKGKFDLYQRTYACTIKYNVNPNYIYGLYAIIKNELSKKISGGTHGSAIPYIVMDDLAKFNIAYNKKTFDKYSSNAKILIEKILENEKENQTLEQLRDTLLPKLMNGEIDLENVEI